MVSEDLTGLPAADPPHLSRDCAEVQLEARQSAAKDAPDLAKRGDVRAEPLSHGLFSQEATNKVFAALPAFIQMPQQNK